MHHRTQHKAWHSAACHVIPAWTRGSHRLRLNYGRPQPFTEFLRPRPRSLAVNLRPTAIFPRVPARRQFRKPGAILPDPMHCHRLWNVNFPLPTNSLFSRKSPFPRTLYSVLWCPLCASYPVTICCHVLAACPSYIDSIWWYWNLRLRQPQVEIWFIKINSTLNVLSV